jgi:hypothetical protein
MTIELGTSTIALLVVPIAIGVLGVRRLRRRPHVPEVAVTITRAAVLFPAIDRAVGVGASDPRRGVASEGDPRRRSLAAGNLDVDGRIIVDALRGPHTS